MNFKRFIAALMAVCVTIALIITFEISTGFAFLIGLILGHLSIIIADSI
jgi:hypothetical protein